VGQPRFGPALPVRVWHEHLHSVLAETYRKDDPLAFIRDMWAADAAQKSEAPNMFQAIDVALRNHHAPGFDDAFMAFTESRYFVGANDDGAHLKNASLLAGAELTVANHVVASDLPLTQYAPPEDKQPSAYGSNHVLLDVPPAWSTATVTFASGQTAWGVRAVAFGGAPTTSTTLKLAKHRNGSATVAVRGHKQLLIAIGNLGPANYQPCLTANTDKPMCNWPKSSYQLSVTGK
jgi:hypothetical protein